MASEKNKEISGDTTVTISVAEMARIIGRLTAGVTAQAVCESKDVSELLQALQTTEILQRFGACIMSAMFEDEAEGLIIEPNKPE